MLILVAMVWGKLSNQHKARFSDAHDYVLGLNAFAAGHDAYGIAPGDAPTGFIYSPLVLKTAAGLARIAPHILLWRTYVGLSLLCIFVTPWLLSCIAGGQPTGNSRWFTPPVAALLFTAEPYLYSLYAALSGNVNVLLLTGMLVSCAAATVSGSWTALYVTVFLSALIKPPFLAFLLLPLLAAQRQVLKAAVTAAAVALAYGLQRLLAPQLYASFRESVRTELVLHRDYGLGIFGLIHEHTSGRFAFMQWRGSLLVHGLVIGAIVAAFCAGRRLRGRPELASLWVPALLVLCILANPRPLDYDLYAGWLAAAFVVIEWLRTAGSTRERVVAAVLLAGFLLVLAFEDLDMFCAGFMLAALVLVVFRIWRLRRLPDEILESSKLRAAEAQI